MFCPFPDPGHLTVENARISFNSRHDGAEVVLGVGPVHDVQRRAMPLHKPDRARWRSTVSPDGRWFAYVSGRVGGPARQSTEGPILARAPVGRSRPLAGASAGTQRAGKLFYRNGEQMMVGGPSTAQQFRCGKPRLSLRSLPDRRGMRGANTTSQPDGHGSDAPPRSEQAAPTQIHVPPPPPPPPPC